MSPNLLSKRRILLLALLLMALASSIAYLHMGGDLHLPPEAEDALSSILEESRSWISRTGNSVFRGGSSLQDLLSPPSGSRGFGRSLEKGLDEEGGMGEERRTNDDGSGEVNDEIPRSSSISAILEFNSSVSRTLFRTWGSLTLLGGSTLEYLILNATLWDGDLLVENTRYMMMDLEPGKSRDFDIREICSLNPDLGYSSLLEAEVPEGLFRPERRDCIVAEDLPGAVIAGSSRYSSRDFYSRDAAPEINSMDTTPLSRTADDAAISSKSTSTYQETSTYRERPAYQETSAYQERPAYQETSAYQERPAYQETSAYQERPAYQGTSAYKEEPTSSELRDSFEDGEYLYIGSKNSDKYHLPDCTSAKKIKKENRVYFRDEWEAREAGYSPCKACNPE